MSQPRYRVRFYPAEQPDLRVDDLRPNGHPTPGNVGVCLSGGGSRALSAGMGQLRALAHLTANGSSLLAQVKALSVVSGAAWLTVPYVYLRGEVSDERYLGRYVADPRRLVPSRQHAALGERPAEDEVLSEIAAGNIGQVAIDEGLDLKRLALEGLFLYAYHEMPPEMLWQTLMGLHVLRPYGLYEGTAKRGFWPEIPFSLDLSSLAEIVADNPTAADEQVQLYAGSVRDGYERRPRPYLICNLAMLLQDEAGYRRLAPVQSTPIFTGVVGAPQGWDETGQAVGGGGVSSFGFLAQPISVHNDGASVEIQRAWTLADVVGTSSAAFAERLENTFVKTRSDPEQAQALSDFIEERIDGWTGRFLPDSLELEDLIPTDDLIDLLGELAEVVPAYRHFCATQIDPRDDLPMTRYADGGSLENTGIGGMLAYADIDRVIAFVNSDVTMRATRHGAVDEHGREVPGSRVLIADQLPPLFGYQPYREGIGYRLYWDDQDPLAPEFANNQFFEQQQFPRLLKALWQSSGGYEGRGLSRPAIAQLKLRVLENTWFGVRGRGSEHDDNPEPIILLLSYTQRAHAWYQQLRAETRALLGDFDNPASFSGFPHYDTLQTCLTPEQVNLLAHFTSWCTAAAPQRDLFMNLFTS